MSKLGTVIRVTDSEILKTIHCLYEYYTYTYVPKYHTLRHTVQCHTYKHVVCTCMNEEYTTLDPIILALKGIHCIKIMNFQ